MKNTFTIILLCLSFGLVAQNASFGIGTLAINKFNTNGVYFTGNVRAQFTERFGWQTEVGYASIDEKITIIEEKPISVYNGGGTITTIEESGSKAMTIKTALTTKLFTAGGLTTEAIIGGGVYKGSQKAYGLLSGELFLSAQIGKNITAGIPLAFNFITWRREEFYTAGISLRFHM